MIKILDKLSLSGSACSGRNSCCLYDHFGLLEGILMPKVAQELESAKIGHEITQALQGGPIKARLTDPVIK